MFTFRNTSDNGDRLARRLRRLLGRWNVKRLGELSMTLREDPFAVQRCLEAMMVAGEVERLRPVDYPRDDQDLFRLKKAGPVTTRRSEPPASQIERDAHQHVQWAAEALVCLID